MNKAILKRFVILTGVKLLYALICSSSFIKDDVSVPQTKLQ